MAEDNTKDQLDAAWWAAWRAEDFSWAGLAKKEWQGYSVFRVGDNRFVAETKSREIYRINSPSALHLQAMRLDEKGVLQPSPPPPAGEVRPEAAEGAFIPADAVLIREANLQDYWRADPQTGRMRTDAALIAAGELVLKANAPFSSPVRGGSEAARAEGAMDRESGQAEEAKQGAAAGPPRGSAARPSQAGGDEVGKLPAETYHIAHLPIEYADGTPTGKGAWGNDALDALASLRLQAAGITAWDGSQGFRMLMDPDRRAQVQCCVWLNMPSHHPILDTAIPYSARFEHSYFGRNVQLSGACILEGVEFNHALFKRGANFDRATFLGRANFRSAVFDAIAGFQAAIFVGGADFGNSTFRSLAWFQGAAFSDIHGFIAAVFDGANFQAEANFERVVFFGQANFSYSSFQEDASFGGACFEGQTNFFYAALCGSLNIRRSFFGGDLNLWGRGAEVLQEVSNQPLSISIVSASKALGEIGTPVGPTTTAYRAIPRIFADRAVFAGDAIISDRDILESSSFRHACFYGKPAFHGSAIHQGVSFFEARFDDALTIGEALPPVPEENLQRMHEAANKVRRIRKEPEISFSEFGVILDARRSEAANTRRKFAALNASPREQANQRFEDLEACFRTLKLAMEDNRNKIEEGFFFKRELLARRRRRDKGVPAWERWFSHGYERFSDFGNSIWRPFWRIFTLIGLYAVIYWALCNVGLGGLINQGQTIFKAPWSEASWKPLLEALSFSAGQVIPFGPWGDPPEESLIAGTLAQPAAGFGLRLIATLQSLTALVLAFLFGLAVRRRFQIS